MTRAEIARAAADALSKINPASVNATIGLDGFVDDIIAVVDTRQDYKTYTEMPDIATFGRKILAAAGQSSNYEFVVKQSKLGGNGPIMANALAAAGLKVTYVGALGYPAMHPVFKELADRATVHSFCEPGHTDALEFSDGKLMLGKHYTLADLSWESLSARVGVEKFAALLQGSKLIAMNNWTMLPRMSDLLTNINQHVLSKLTGDRRTFFVDLADPEKRTREDLRNVLAILGKMQQHVEVTLGVNLKESDQVAEVLGLPSYPDSEPHIETRAAAIREKMGVACIVIHPRKGAAAATKEGSASIKGPFIKEPKLSTGAGDNFNAGFCLGRAFGLPLPQALATAVASSGFYVREGRSAGHADLIGFLKALPEPQ
jgi:hypothetical protein